MNNSLLMPIMDTSIMMVKVKFRQSDIYYDANGQKKKAPRSADDPGAWSKEYTYKAKRALMLKVGDPVLVQARDWYQVARVTEVDVPVPMDDTTMNFRWVVTSVAGPIAELVQLETKETALTKALDRKRAEIARAQALDALGLTEQEAALLTNK